VWYLVGRPRPCGNVIGCLSDIIYNTNTIFGFVVLGCTHGPCASEVNPSGPLANGPLDFIVLNEYEWATCTSN